MEWWRRTGVITSHFSSPLSLFCFSPLCFSLWSHLALINISSPPSTLSFPICLQFFFVISWGLKTAVLHNTTTTPAVLCVCVCVFSHCVCTGHLCLCPKKEVIQSLLQSDSVNMDLSNFRNLMRKTQTSILENGFLVKGVDELKHVSVQFKFRSDS